MESFLELIKITAPAFLVGILASILILKLIVMWIRWQVKSLGKKSEKIKTALQCQSKDVEAVEAEFESLGGSCETCTKDDPNIGCPTAAIDPKLAKLRKELKQIEKESNQVERRLNLIRNVFLSPLGKIISFIANTENYKEGEKP